MRHAAACVGFCLLNACGNGGSLPPLLGQTGDSGTQPDATVPTDAATAVTDSSTSTDAPRDASLNATYYAGCNAPCASGCTGLCSAGRCLDTVVDGVVIVNNRSVVDETSVYWYGLVGDAAILDYSVQSAPKAGGGSVATLASYDRMADAGFMAVEPIAGYGGAVFFGTIGPDDYGPGQVFAAWTDGGVRDIFSPAGGAILGLATNAGGIYASFSSNPPSLASVLVVAIDGGAPKTIYTRPVGGLGAGAGALAVNSTAYPYGGILSGSLDGSTELVNVALGADLGFARIAMDETYVYWQGNESQTVRNRIYRAPIRGGGPIELFLEDDIIEAFAVDDTSFYWAAAHPGGTPYLYSQAKIPTAGGPVTLSSCEEAGGISIDDAYVYVTSDSIVWRAPK